MPSTPAVAAAKASCGGLFIGEIVAGDGIQRLANCGFSFNGNPIKVSAIDVGVSILPPIVVMAVVAFPGFPPKPTVVAQCANLLTCRGSGNYQPTGPFGDRLFCVFGAFSGRITVEVAYRFKCTSGDTGGILPI